MFPTVPAGTALPLAVGPNYNLDVDGAREKRAHEELQKAKDYLSANWAKTVS